MAQREAFSEALDASLANKADVRDVHDDVANEDLK